MPGHLPLDLKAFNQTRTQRISCCQGGTLMRNGSYARASAFAIVTILVCTGLASSAIAQTQSTPKFVTLTPRYLGNLAAPATPTIPNWTGSLTAGGTSFTMVGTNPQTTNTTT